MIVKSLFSGNASRYKFPVQSVIQKCDCLWQDAAEERTQKPPADDMAGICYDVYQNLTLLGPTLLGTPLWRY